MAKKTAVDINHYDVVLAPHITEKSTLLSEQNAVVFKVANDATKPQIKAAGGQLIVVDSLDVQEAKTKALTEQLGTLGLGKTALVIDGDALNVGFAMGSSNLRQIDLMPAAGANVYDILKHETLVLTRAAVEKLEARFNG
jgi:ribosomal protein L23